MAFSRLAKIVLGLKSVKKFRVQAYDIEDRIREDSVADQLVARQSETVPILALILTALGKCAVRELPKSHLGQAASYACNQ